MSRCLYIWRDTLTGWSPVCTIREDDNGTRTLTYAEAFERLALLPADRKVRGLSSALEPDGYPFEEREFKSFFTNLLPEGSTTRQLSRMMRVATGDYLGMLGHMGFETIGALLMAPSPDTLDKLPTPGYEPAPPELFDDLAFDPVVTTARFSRRSRLSLSGAQTKISLALPEGMRIEDANPSDWLVPTGAAASTHLVKLASPSEVGILWNESACAHIARHCGFRCAIPTPVKGLPNAIAVPRFDRIWVDDPTYGRRVLRLHQEDLCQAVGLEPYLKYQIKGDPHYYPSTFVKPAIEGSSLDAKRDIMEFALRTMFDFLIGNSDNHLKNTSLLYSPDWTQERLAPRYDMTCIPLTDYSTSMAFPLGTRWEPQEVTSSEIAEFADSLGVNRGQLARETLAMAEGIESFDIETIEDARVRHAAEGVIEYAMGRPRDVLRTFAEEALEKRER